jgi:hypothetical protein
MDKQTAKTRKTDDNDEKPGVVQGADPKDVPDDTTRRKNKEREADRRARAQPGVTKGAEPPPRAEPARRK